MSDMAREMAADPNAGPALLLQYARWLPEIVLENPAMDLLFLEDPTMTKLIVATCWDTIITARWAHYEGLAGGKTRVRLRHFFTAKALEAGASQRAVESNRFGDTLTMDDLAEVCFKASRRMAKRLGRDANFGHLPVMREAADMVATSLGETIPWPTAFRPNRRRSRR